MEINKQYINQSASKRPMIKMTPKWLTIHSTGNPGSTAQNERDYLASPNNTRQASFHIVIDEKQAICCIPLNEVAYHAGDGQGDGNRASIGIEICESGNRAKTLDNAASVVAMLLDSYGWGIERVVQHNHWSGKNCPRILRVGNGWQQFLKQVESKMKEEFEVFGLPVILPDGKEITVGAILDKDKNYVAVRELLESLGYKVDFKNQKVVIKK